MGIQKINLDGVARTLLVPLACRVAESARQDAMLHDPQAERVFKELSGGRDFFMGMSKLDQLFTVMRARQFDTYARIFLDQNPDGLVVDIGCGLDTRFDRLDQGRMTWLGLDLPEVITLRRKVLPEQERSQAVAQSVFDPAWMEIVKQIAKPTTFLAEGVFVYFKENEVKQVISGLAKEFPGSELAFDILSTFSVKMHYRSSSVLKDADVHIYWGVDDPRSIEPWGLHLLDRWGYFDKHEPRLGLANLMRYIPVFKNVNYLAHYRLGVV